MGMVPVGSVTRVTPVGIRDLLAAIMVDVSAQQDAWAAGRVRDRRLVSECLAGDEDAWAELWRRYGPVVKAVARRSGCDAEEARDVLQRVALVALQGLERLREPAKLPGWLAGIARYQALELIRRRRPGEQLYEWSAVINNDPGRAIDRDRELAILRQALCRLDVRCRRLIDRLDLKEPADSYKEAAEAEGLSPTSIGPIRRRCLNRLKKIIANLSRSAPADHFQGEE